MACIVAIGDYGTSSPSFVAATEEWPYLLQRLIGTPVINEGEISDSAVSMAGRFDDDVLGYVPQFIIIQAGNVDIAAGTSAVLIEAAIGSMITAGLAEGATVIVLTVLPDSNYDAPKNAVLDAVNVWILSQSGIVAIDVYDSLEDALLPHVLDSSYDSGDGKHLNAAGMALMASLIEDELVPLLTIPIKSAHAARLERMLNQTCVVEPFAAYDGEGLPTYGAQYTAMCRIEPVQRRQERSAEEVLTGQGMMVMLGADDPITSRSRLTPPSECGISGPIIVAVDIRYDGRGEATHKEARF